MKKIFLTFLIGLAFGKFCAEADSQPGGDGFLNNSLPKDLSPQGQQEKATWTERQRAIDLARADAQVTLDYLQTDAAAKSQDAKIAQVQVDNLKKDLLYEKNLDPRDPWREIHGEKKFVMSLGTGIVQFRGQVQDATPNGLRISGQIGDETGVDYFVVNFPYQLEAGEKVDPTKIFVAFEDGVTTYETEEGYTRTIPKLNYGKPCARPQNADAIELAAKKLTPAEEAQIKSAELEAQTKSETAAAARKRLQESQDLADAEWKAAIEKLRQDQAAALSVTQGQAEKGDAAALRRMAERYRDGDGVEKNLARAADFFKKAEAAAKSQNNSAAGNVR
jgi:hypothetical protein